MTAEVEIQHDQVRRAAQHVRAAADAAVSRHDADVARLGDALPGSVSAAAAARLADAWAASSRRWAAAAHDQAQRLEAATTASAAGDDRAARRLDRLASRLGGPVAR